MGATQPVRIAMLGSGIFAKEAHLPAIAQLQGCMSLLANWSRSETSAVDFQQCAQEQHQIQTEIYSGEVGLSSILERDDIDAVIIALPITSQPNIIRRCLQAGKHVLSEKPVAPSVGAARQLIAEYEQNHKSKGLIWEVAEQFYHEPRYKRVREILDAGKLGQVHFFQQTVFLHMKEGSKYHSTSWRTIPEYQGGFLLDGGVHFVAGLAAMFGPIASVNGGNSLHRSHLAPSDTCYAMCKTESGVDGTVMISMGASPTLNKTETIISCEKGHIQLSTASDDEGGWRLIVHEENQSAPSEERFPSSGIYHEIRSFVDDIQALLEGNAQAKSNTAEAALKDLAFIEACINGRDDWVELGLMQ